MSYRVADYLDEHPLSAKKQRAIDNMSELEALSEVLDAAEKWDSEINEYIFQELSPEEQKGYALANIRHEKAIEIVTRMIKEKRDERPGILLWRDQLEAWAGHDLTDEQVEQVDTAIQFSSIPDAIAEIVFNILPLEEDEEEES